MDKQSQAISNNVGTLVEDARALMTATADVAEGKVVEARKRLAIALENSRKIVDRVREKAVEEARTADQAVREHPYQTIGIAMLVGAVVGLLLVRPRATNDAPERI